VQIPQREGAIFGGCPVHSKALAIFAAAVAAAFAAKGIIQYAARQAQIGIRIPENYERRRCGLSAMKGMMSVHSAGEV